MTDSTLHADTASDAVSVVDGGTVGDYIALLKPRVMSLVIFTAFVGYVLAPSALHPVLGAIAIFAVAVGAGASGAINMWYDRDIDAVMARTKGRPIPAGRVNADEALAFGVVLSIGSVVVMGLAVNWLAAGLLALTIGYYVFFYTMWLKRRTPQNIVVGGAAGAFPPVIGWAAVTGSLSVEPLLLFAIIFMWTPPHFWALALFRNEDYTRAGVPMMPVVAGEFETRRQIVIYSVLLAPLGVAPWWLGFAGPLFGSVAAVLGGVFLLGAVRVWRDDQERHCRQLFGFSILYLFAIFAILLVDRGIAVL
ncbi:MAG: heme o synthase [Alphaproteobacteria bacterium]|nr:heme o synthase [Alphaproteobacteria bacterium]